MVGKEVGMWSVMFPLVRHNASPGVFPQLRIGAYSSIHLALGLVSS